jgi:hypothetical protein
VALILHVADNAPLESVQVRYKRMPAYYDWLSIEMEPAGSGTYRAEVPVTSEGILYYFSATDGDGNAANFPNFLTRTPYFVYGGYSLQPRTF